MNKSNRIVKLLSASFTILLFSFFLPPKSIYTVPFNDINNQKVNLFPYMGKKIVFITLSGKEADSTLEQLSAFCRRYKDSTVIIGVLSIEDGYNEAEKKAIKASYNSKMPGLMLTEGMYTRNASKDQSGLMQWLTHKEQNLRVDKEVTEAGCKFFIDEGGVLYSALGAHFPLSSLFVQRIMSKPKRPRPSAADLEKRRNEMKLRKQGN
ncbi:hypothetical protein A4H97_21630 [Niastella yeongjuensis]|uniref:Alkyl hydroperoxide reductase subunit C/ Thiol specific antioxidant domain-containing protein n=1 Tax=Niastella yeongjuensis TaxID=354355 RepID=A0A1V9F831_9BACT|nr:hypothetical protein [Niastella yeongjuensis]OQP54573.1 hypothetical protein A4H97_21630 [Niastella yeongjuensis]SEN99362.1 hypothetical protein SAMN05660816_01839 [Niastella yeongjuensis]